MAAGMKNGRYLARAALQQGRVFALDDVEPADAGADVHADALGIVGVILQAGHLHGFIRRGEGEVDEAAHLLDFFFLDEVERVEVLDFGCNLAGELGSIKRCVSRSNCSNCTPLLPASKFFQTSSVVLPTPQIKPIPVTTTRRRQIYFPPFAVLSDVVDRVFHGADLLRVLVGNLDVESFFEGHDQFDGVERVGAQVVHERGAGGDFAFVHSELLDDDLLYLFVNCCHVFSLMCRYMPACESMACLRSDHCAENYLLTLACLSM